MATVWLESVLFLFTNIVIYNLDKAEPWCGQLAPDIAHGAYLGITKGVACDNKTLNTQLFYILRIHSLLYDKSTFTSMK